jgi:hypothetical protein
VCGDDHVSGPITLSAVQFFRFDGIALPRDSGDHVVEGQISKDVLGVEEPATPELSVTTLSDVQSGQWANSAASGSRGRFPLVTCSLLSPPFSPEAEKVDHVRR